MKQRRLPRWNLKASKWSQVWKFYKSWLRDSIEMVLRTSLHTRLVLKSMWFLALNL